jgi:uncharacterized protein (DUF927 family)
MSEILQDAQAPEPELTAHDPIGADTAPGQDDGIAATIDEVFAEFDEDEDCEIQGDFRVLRCKRGGDNPGVYRRQEILDEDTKEKTLVWTWFCSQLRVLADTRDSHNTSWGRLLEITDRDGQLHHWSMPMNLMAGNGDEYRRRLLDYGVTLSCNRYSRLWLGDYLSSWRPRDRVRCVDRIGWHGEVFVLPDQTYGNKGSERVLLQSAGAAPKFVATGTLEAWQRDIAGLAVGNSRLVLAISQAFAGSVLHLVGEESGGVHLQGGSSIGKTAAAHAARSVWGVPLGSWRTTDNATEALAANACDTLLVLDEIGQASPHVVSEVGYMLGNGRGKERLRRDATARPPLTWRVTFLSTGEIGLAAALAEGGRRVMAGQQARVLEIPADAGAGYGLFENRHGLAGGAELSEHFRHTADRECGHAGRRFLELLMADMEGYRTTLWQAREEFIAGHCPPGADGQVRRACGRFGLIAAAGALATALGVLPWPDEEAERAAARCFTDWLAQRGGKGPAEITAGLKQVLLFLEKHGASRFEPAWPGTCTTLDKTMNRAGFRKATDDGRWAYYVLPENWRSELCKGFDASLIARAMIERGWMERADGDNLARKTTVPGLGQMRLYTIKPEFMEAS